MRGSTANNTLTLFTRFRVREYDQHAPYIIGGDLSPRLSLRLPIVEKDLVYRGLPCCLSNPICF